MVNIHIRPIPMKISPIILLLGLGLIVLPETIINIPLFPFGRAEAATVPLMAYNTPHVYTEHNQSTTTQHYQSTTTQNNISTPQHYQSTTTQHNLSNGVPLPIERSSAVGGRYPLECAACEYLANGVNQTVLHNPKVIAFVTADIEKVCSVLPESVQAMCNDAAQSVAPMLLDHLGDFIVTEGCDDLGVCH